MQPIVLGFEDFKSLSGRHRVYYFEGLNFFDFHYLVDGQIIKTRMLKEHIDNLQRFFSDKMFFGAMRLEFNIPVKEENIFSLFDARGTLNVDNIQDEETKNTDIQEEAVED